MSILNLITSGTYLICNSNILHSIFPKWVKNKSGEYSKTGFHVFYTSVETDPNRECIHRFLIAPNAVEEYQRENGEVGYRPSWGPKVLHVKNNTSQGLDFHILEPKGDWQEYSMPLRKLRIKPLVHETGWQLLGYCDEGNNVINVATFNLTSILREYVKVV